MAAFLRGAAAHAHRAALSPRNLASSQQVRHAGDLPVKANKHIEEWGAQRENLEQTFEWNRSTISQALIWIVAVPTFFYVVCKREMRSHDAVTGRPHRHLM